MGKTNIEWADETWPVTRGCTLVSAGCTNCYAMNMAARIVRMGKGAPTKYDGLTRDTPTGPKWVGAARFCPEELATPLRKRKGRRIFVSSMSDLFHDDISNEEIAAVFGVMAAAKQHSFMVLTKRAARMRAWFAWAEQHGNGYDAARFGPSALLTCAWAASAGDCLDDWDIGLPDLPSPETFGAVWPLPNVMLGVSVENQAAAVDRIPHLQATPAAVRWISAEPLLGDLDLRQWMSWPEVENGGPDARHHCTVCGLEREPGRDEEHVCPPGFGPSIDLVIAGCESGPGARPADVAWYRSLRDQCAAAGVAYFLKQAREERTLPADIKPVDIRALAAGPNRPFSVGAITAGPGSHRKPGGVIGAPYLDGVQHLAFPEVSRGR